MCAGLEDDIEDLESTVSYLEEGLAKMGDERDQLQKEVARLTEKVEAARYEIEETLRGLDR